MALSSNGVGKTSGLDDVEAAEKKDTSPKDALLFGRFDVAPTTVYNSLIVTFVFFFVLHRLADFTYLFTVDCKFPKGLQSTYGDEIQQQQCLAYTRSVQHVVIAWSFATFVVMMAILCTRFMVTLDKWAGDLVEKALELFTGVQNTLFCCPWSCLSSCVSGCCGCLCCPCSRLGLAPKWRQLFHGAIYLTFFSALLYLVDAPFKMRMYEIDAYFGFANTVSMPVSAYKKGIILGFFGIFTANIPTLMLYIWVCSWRYGWLLMWALLVFAMTVGQFFLYDMASMVIGPAQIFPSAYFGVGRDFPLVQNENEGAVEPIVSLNRIYYPTNQSNKFITKDLSRGDIELDTPATQTGKSSQWELRDSTLSDTALPFAETMAKIKFHDDNTSIEALVDEAWSLSGNDSNKEARVGFRNGKFLRDALLDFAEERGVHINEVYLVDSSSKDARANAFAAGAGNGRIIALYDTLFLGENGSMTVKGGADVVPNNVLSIRHWSNVIQGVPTTAVHKKPTWYKGKEFRHQDPGGGTTAMSDIEILAVMGHELGHSALHHAERGILQEAVTSFATFALLGWTLHSPVLAAGIGLAAPVVHVGIFMFQHLTQNILNSVMNPIENALTRSQEYAADAYSARVSPEYANALQTSLAKLTVSCNQDPNKPWYEEMLHDDHPTLAHRWQQVARIKNRLYSEDDNLSTVAKAHTRATTAKNRNRATSL